MPLRFLGLFLVIFLSAMPAHAGMFSAVGNVCRELAHSIVEDLGVPVTVISVLWGLLAAALRLGGMVVAVGGLITGVCMMNAEALVEALWAAGH